MLAMVRHTRYVLSENPVTGLSFGLFALFLIAAILGPAIAPYNPLQSDAANALKAPSAAKTDASRSRRFSPCRLTWWCTRHSTCEAKRPSTPSSRRRTYRHSAWS